MRKLLSRKGISVAVTIFLLLANSIEANAVERTLTLKKIVFTYPAEVDIPETGCTVFPLTINSQAAGALNWTLAVWMPNAKQTKSKRFLDAFLSDGESVNDPDFAQTSLFINGKIGTLILTTSLEVCRENKPRETVGTLFGVSPGTYQILFTDNLLFYNESRMGSEYVLGDITFSDSKARGKAAAESQAEAEAQAEAQAQSAKKKTITCTKGKVTKKIKGINPKCPKGYKKK